MNFYKPLKTSKKTDSVNQIRSGSLNTIRSNTLFKKVPITRSDMQNFKQRIELSAMQAIKSPDLVKLIDKDKVAKNVQNLMKEALDESEHTHKVPVIDVGRFITKSLNMNVSNENPTVITFAEKKDTGDANKGRSDNEKTDSEPEVPDTTKNKQAKAEKIPKPITKKVTVEKQVNKGSPEMQLVVQSLKSLPNHGYTNRVPSKSNPVVQGQSKTTGSLIAKQKVPVPKNLNQIPEKFSSQTDNEEAAPKTGKSERPDYGKGVTKRPSYVKTRSNSTLRTGGLPAGNKPNPAPVAKPAEGQRESQRRLMSAPVPSFSSASSRMLYGFKNAHSGMGASSHSYFSKVGKTSSGLKKNVDPIIQLREEVNQAIREKKTFTVSGRFPAVRRALVKRGWVEKYSGTNRERLQNEMNSLKNRSINQLVDLLQVKDLNEICKKLIKSKLLGNHQVDLYWGHNYDSFKLNNDKVKLTKINKFRRDVFSYTSKQGLSDAAKNAHWFNFPGLAHINHPRTYALAKNGETKDFIKDFRRTAAMSLLKWIIKSHETKECKIISFSGKIPLEAFQFACNECYKLVIEANNQDIDQPIKDAMDHEWSQFLEYYYKILHIGNHFKASNTETEDTIVEKSQYLINKLIPHYPHLRMDGTMNIWILKPAVGSQGKGIHICRTLQYIMNTVKTNVNVRYIAQKYIERPLLIFNTKFDIRQWFLISCALPLTIWMYKECYLRFSSQTYNLRKLHESVHLTNNSVQKHYQSTSHDITLPNYNMWDSIQFKNYLSNIGFPDIYKRVIYKGMKECIIGAVMIHQDKIDKRKNCFELYGADFMLTEDFQPWLIEINSSPALFASTPITSRMCPQVLEDAVKVVVDHAANPKAKTGNFELIYKQPNLNCNNNANMNTMKIKGKPLPKDYFCLEEDKNAKRIQPLSITETLQLEKSLSKSKSDVLTQGVKETLENLLKFIQSEKKRRQKKTLVTKDPIISMKETIDQKRSSSTSTSLSFSSLKSNLNLLAGSSQISFTKEDENMLDQALKMLKNKKDGDVVRYLLEIVERITNQISQNET
ncbi:tubulin glycylase 3B-like isoform X2 [Harmonia axyridis]|uniref:tubulin glycylase 3B-like isoform X2 n=1 Tax=Harmonia axyridis TaxID=115357 RepID=UPI001E2757AF|nr:tubulin glycylase 3B-like isoform X2 [Harmonia axyridis]